MCAGGPPNPVTPIRVHSIATVRSEAARGEPGSGGAGGCGVWAVGGGVRRTLDHGPPAPCEGIANARQAALAAAAVATDAASPTHRRTMSRIERIPTISEPSMTITWRKPPRTICSAASSSGQSGWA